MNFYEQNLVTNHFYNLKNDTIKLNILVLRITISKANTKQLENKLTSHSKDGNNQNGGKSGGHDGGHGGKRCGRHDGGHDGGHGGD